MKAFYMFFLFILVGTAGAEYAYYLKMSPLKQVRHHIGYDYLTPKGVKIPGYSFIEFISNVDHKMQRVFLIYPTANEAVRKPMEDLKLFVSQFPNLYDLTLRCKATAMVYEDPKEKSFYFRIGYGSDCNVSYMQGAVSYD